MIGSSANSDYRPDLILEVVAARPSVVPARHAIPEISGWRKLATARGSARPHRRRAEHALARPALPPRRHLGRGGGQLRAVLQACRARRAVPLRSQRAARSRARRAPRAHEFRLALLPARCPAGPALW